MHETGHAMYDVGLPPEFADQPVGRDRGMALEESQSLLMEMIVCRSRPFVTYLKPLLEKHFGVSGPEWSEENLYRASHPREARTDSRRCRRAHLHACTSSCAMSSKINCCPASLRCATCATPGIPAWNSGWGSSRRVTWKACCRMFTGPWDPSATFPSYALGAVMAAQFSEALRESVPDVDREIARGDFSGLMGWLRQNVHGVGARVSAQELLKHGHRQAAVGRRGAALPRSEIPRARIGRRQRRGMTGGTGAPRSPRGCGSWPVPSLVVLIAAMLVPAMPQPLSYHAFADCRTIWSHPQLLQRAVEPALPGGRRPGPGHHLARRRLLRRSRASSCPTWCSSWARCSPVSDRRTTTWHPTTPRLVWDRLPMTLGFAGLVAAAVAERVDLRLGLRSLWPLLAHRRGHGHLLVRHRAHGRRQHHSLRRLPGLVDPGHRAADRDLSRRGATAMARCCCGPRAGTAWPRCSKPSICGSTGCWAAVERTHHQTSAGGGRGIRHRAPAAAAPRAASLYTCTARMNATPASTRSFRRTARRARMAFADREEARRAAAWPGRQGHRGLPHDRAAAIASWCAFRAARTRTRCSTSCCR